MKPTVTCSCIGREVPFGGELGNQLFQIAAVLGYAEKHDLTPAFHPWRCVFSGRDYGSLFPQLHYTESIRVDSVLIQSTARYEVFPRQPWCDLRGMFQSERFFPSDHAVLRTLLAAPRVLEKDIASCTSNWNEMPYVALHMRYYDRPVVDSTPVMHNLPDHYYAEGLRHLPTELPVVIVTNNPDRARLFAARHGKGRNCFVQSHRDPLVDFYLLTRSRALVMGNSTFGWWAAWLTSPQTPIFCPVRNKWFSFRARITDYWDASDIYPTRFQELNF